MKSLAQALLVFFFMALFAYHIDTGFLANLTEKVPRAVVGFDAFIDIAFVSWLGKRGTVLLMAGLTVLIPVSIIWHSMRASSKDAPAPATIDRSRVKRATAHSRSNTAKPVLTADEKQFMENLLHGAAAQIVREREMMEAAKRPAPFVRLVPQAPIRQQQTARSWFGGIPSLAPGTQWPLCDGKPATFIAQIDCSELPHDLWEGLGARSGSLCFFLGDEDRRWVTKVLHVQEPLTPVVPPTQKEFEWLWSSCITDHGLDELVRREIPQWPIDIVRVAHIEEDPFRNGRSEEVMRQDPRRAPYEQTDFSLSDPGLRPFDWESTLLMLDLAAAYARRNLSYRQDWLEKDRKILANWAAGEASAAPSAEAREKTEWRVASGPGMIASWQDCIARVEALRGRIEIHAGSRPFDDAEIDSLIAELATLTIEDRNEVKRIQAFPLDHRPQSRSNWLSDWAELAAHHAKHRYAKDIFSLPPAWRAKVEEQAAYDASTEMGAMRDIPDGYVHEFELVQEVTLLQLSSSQLMNWIWGDVYNLVLTIRKQDLAWGDFSRVNLQITN